MAKMARSFSPPSDALPTSQRRSPESPLHLAAVFQERGSLTVGMPRGAQLGLLPFKSSQRIRQHFARRFPVQRNYIELGQIGLLREKRAVEQNL
jgi:hypothetical protein